MTDIALAWDAENFCGALAIGAGAVRLDDGLRTAILISLFTDARAPAGAMLPEDGDDRRGWWGDDLAADGSAAGTRDAIGSTLWMLRRAKVTPITINQAREATSAALGWLLRDGVASALSVEVEAQGQTLAIGVVIDRPEGPARQRFDFAWDASTGEIA